MRTSYFNSLKVFSAAVLFSLGGSAWGLSVVIHDPHSDRPEKIDFGVLSSTVVYHTAPQYLEVTHPDLPFRRIYLYSDNNAGFGTAQEGLVSTATAGAFYPLYFQNYKTKPVSVSYTASDAAAWPPLADRSSSGFVAQKDQVARLYPGDNFTSWVYLGLQIRPENRGRGGFGARLVVEDWSDYDDVVGPAIQNTMMNDLIMVAGIPVGVSATLQDQNIISGYTFNYRMEDGPPGYIQVKGENPASIQAEAGGDPFHWKAEVVLDPLTLRAPGILDYYFTAVDTFTNISTSTLYRTNLIPQSSAASLPYSPGTGSVGIAIGDLRWPGLQLQFPAGSLTSSGNITVKLKDAAQSSPMGGQKPARVVQLGPDSLTFAHPATLLLPYLDQNADGKEDGTGVKETDLRVFWFDGFDWRYVGGTVNPDTNQVRVNVTHLGEFGLFAYSGELMADLVRPKERILTFNYPNDLLRFTGLDAAQGSYDIEIFDIRGSSVRKLHNSPDWDGRDENGTKVESGTYVYRFNGQGLTLSGMVAVAR